MQSTDALHPGQSEASLWREGYSRQWHHGHGLAKWHVWLAWSLSSWTVHLSSSCCKRGLNWGGKWRLLWYLVGEERQMAELMPVGDNNFSDSDGEGLEVSWGERPTQRAGEHGTGKFGTQHSFDTACVWGSSCLQHAALNKDLPQETPVAEDKCKNLKTKPFRCKPCQYEAESEEQFVHHIRVHSAKKFFVEEKVQRSKQKPGNPALLLGKRAISPRAPSFMTTVATIPIFMITILLTWNITRAGDNERVYKCIICTYTPQWWISLEETPEKPFSKESLHMWEMQLFSDRKNNYVQHVQTHTGKSTFLVSVLYTPKWKMWKISNISVKECLCTHRCPSPLITVMNYFMHLWSYPHLIRIKQQLYWDILHLDTIHPFTVKCIGFSMFTELCSQHHN